MTEMSQSNRRVFLMQVAVAGAGLVAASAYAAEVDEKDPTAAGLGYKPNATKVDKTKFPKYADGQKCSNCALFQGKAGEATGPCPLFAGKVVSANGWCSAYNKKAG
jgi:hypothetical protein